jgi:sulfite reductase alpha subunit-like flavoprotein
MAADVDRALRQVIRAEGALSEDAASSFVFRLTAEGRYRRDDY